MFGINKVFVCTATTLTKQIGGKMIYVLEERMTNELRGFSNLVHLILSDKSENHLQYQIK